MSEPRVSPMCNYSVRDIKNVPDELILRWMAIQCDTIAAIVAGTESDEVWQCI